MAGEVTKLAEIREATRIRVSGANVSEMHASYFAVGIPKRGVHFSPGASATFRTLFNFHRYERIRVRTNTVAPSRGFLPGFAGRWRIEATRKGRGGGWTSFGEEGTRQKRGSERMALRGRARGGHTRFRLYYVHGYLFPEARYRVLFPFNGFLVGLAHPVRITGGTDSLLELCEVRVVLPRLGVELILGLCSDDTLELLSGLIRASWYLWPSARKGRPFLRIIHVY